MTLCITALCSGPFTGASLNPARTFGTSIIWKDGNVRFLGFGVVGYSIL